MPKLLGMNDKDILNKGGGERLLSLEILRMKDKGASPVSISMYQYINSFVAGDLYICTFNVH